MNDAASFFRSMRVAVAAATLLLAGLSVRAQDGPVGAAAPTVPDQVAAAYRFADFAELERLYAMYGKPGLRSELTGRPRIGHFWNGIDSVSNSKLRVTDEYFVQLDALTERWSRLHPESLLAQLLYAEALNTHAWAYRGNGYANTVSPASMAAFRKYIALGAAQLQRAEPLATHDSSWNWLMMGAGLGLGWGGDRMRSLFESGLAKDPDNDNLYFTMQTSLLPKWGGSIAAVERFIAMADTATRAKRGGEMYSRLYAALSYDEAKERLFTDTRASWPAMKAGFEDLLKRYPHTDNRNMYAYFACMADDRPVLRELLEGIADAFDRTFWGDSPERSYEACQRLAKQT